MIEVVGSGRERGEALGEAHRDLIAEALERWKASVSGRPVAELIRSLVRDTSFRDTAARLTPDLLDEVRGTAEGAGQPFDDVFAYQLTDESWWWWRPTTPAPGCTVVAMPGADGTTVLGQNMDLPDHFEGSQVVVRQVLPDGHAQVVLAAAGHLGFTGASSRGIVVLVNALLDLPTSAAGLPVAFVIRHVLGARDLAEARQRLTSVPHASGQSYLIGSVEGLAAFECSARGVTELAVGPTYCHTNHELATGGAPGSEGSVRRLDFCSAGMAAGRPGRELAWELLSDRTVPLSLLTTADVPASTFGTIVVQTGVPPHVDVALGPPSHMARLPVAWG